MAKMFQTIRGFRPPRSTFNLSYTKLFTGDLGELYPVCLYDCIPGDIFSLANNVVIRFMPMVAPILHAVSIFMHYFFVPYRLLWDSWEDFITGGEDGSDSSTLPTWNVTDNAVGSLWDLLGFPTGVTPDADNRPVAFPQYAYNQIYNEFYRDQNLVTALTITSAEDIQKRAWVRDYFTSALPWVLKGTAPTLPITSTVDASSAVGGTSADNAALRLQINNGADTIATPSGTYNTDLENALEKLSVSSASIDMATFRLTAMINQWMERNARGGSRYVEWLMAHHGIAPNDARLQLPEFIGGTRAPLIISEVLQTESSDATTAQGTMAGHGISAGVQRVGRYRVQEFGLIMGILSIMPETMYSQGINKQWTRSSRYDYYNPSFAHLSEQAIERKELYTNGVKADNETVFGYQGIYDEYRKMTNQVSGEMRYGQTYDHWNLGRYFSGAPSLNQTFIECDGTTAAFKRFLAVPSEPAFMAHVGNITRAARPIPAIATPGITRI